VSHFSCSISNDQSPHRRRAFMTSRIFQSTCILKSKDTSVNLQDSPMFSQPVHRFQISIQQYHYQLVRLYTDSTGRGWGHGYDRECRMCRTQYGRTWRAFEEVWRAERAKDSKFKSLHQKLKSTRARLLSFTGNGRYSVLKTSNNSPSPTTTSLIDKRIPLCMCPLSYYAMICVEDVRCCS